MTPSPKPFRTLSALSALYALFAFSSCTIGPLTPTQELPRLDVLNPDGFVRRVPGLYFELITNSDQTAISALADEIYKGILADIKLSQTARAFSLYPIYLYSTREEYSKKSKMPDWSDGVFKSGAILTYLHPNPLRTKGVLAHEISHLVFWEFFGSSRTDLLWLNEGLAMHEDSKAQGHSPQEHSTSHKKTLRDDYLSLTKLVQTKSAREHKPNEAKIFYIESWFLVKYLLEKGGNVGFFEMMNALKNKSSLDEAMTRGFPAKWRSLNDLEQAFKREYLIP